MVIDDVLELPRGNANCWISVKVSDYVIQSLIGGQREVTPLVRHTTMDHYIHSSSKESKQYASISDHLIE